MTSKNYYFRRIYVLAGVALCALVSAVPAHARYAEIDSVFLNRRTAEMEALGDSLLAQTAHRHQLYAHINEVLDLRREALAELGSRLRITSFDAIETQDEYGEVVLLVIGRFLERARELPHRVVTPEEVAAYRDAMGVVPDLGWAPAPYLVAAAMEGISNKVEAVRPTLSLAPETIESLSLDMFADAYRQLTTDQPDEITATRVESFRQDSVVERIRCPKDGSNYRVRQIKNKMFADETFATIWYVRCNICYEDREIWFPHIYLEKLMKAEKKQNLATPPKKIDPHGGLEP